MGERERTDRFRKYLAETAQKWLESRQENKLRNCEEVERGFRKTSAQVDTPKNDLDSFLNETFRIYSIIYYAAISGLCTHTDKDVDEAKKGCCIPRGFSRTHSRVTGNTTVRVTCNTRNLSLVPSRNLFEVPSRNSGSTHKSSWVTKDRVNKGLTEEVEALAEKMHRLMLENKIITLIETTTVSKETVLVSGTTPIRNNRGSKESTPCRNKNQVLWKTGFSGNL